jgi:hypothetical protein
VPGYHWKGTTAQGVKIEGDLDASSKEGAVEQLRRQQITVSKIVETSAGGPIDTRPRERENKPPRFTRFKSLSIAAMFATAAAAVGYIAPITFWSCERAGGTVACSISERDLGVIELRGWRLADVKSVELETQMVTSSDRDRRTRLQKRIVFLDAKGGSIRSFGWDQSRPREWFRRPRVASSDIMFEEFQRFLGDDTATRQSTWGVFWVPLILVGVLLLLSLLTVLMTAASLFVRPEWAQALVNEHASKAGKRASKFR